MVKTLYITAALMLSLTAGLFLVKRFYPVENEGSFSDQIESRGTRITSANPLLTASKLEFERWLPPYCGPDLYMSGSPKKHAIDVCVNGTIQRVKTATGITLNRSQVLDPEVRVHWQQTMGARP